MSKKEEIKWEGLIATMASIIMPPLQIMLNGFIAMKIINWLFTPMVPVTWGAACCLCLGLRFVLTRSSEWGGSQGMVGS